MIRFSAALIGRIGSIPALELTNFDTVELLDVAVICLPQPTFDISAPTPKTRHHRRHRILGANQPALVAISPSIRWKMGSTRWCHCPSATVSERLGELSTRQRDLEIATHRASSARDGVWQSEAGDYEQVIGVVLAATAISSFTNGEI